MHNPAFNHFRLPIKAAPCTTTVGLLLCTKPITSDLFYAYKKPIYHLVQAAIKKFESKVFGYHRIIYTGENLRSLNQGHFLELG